MEANNKAIINVQNNNYFDEPNAMGISGSRYCITVVKFSALNDSNHIFVYDAAV